MFKVHLLVVEVALIATYLLALSPAFVQGFVIFYPFATGNRIPQQLQLQLQQHRRRQSLLLWGIPKQNQYEDEHDNDDLEDERMALEEYGGDPSFLEVQDNNTDNNTGNNNNGKNYYDSKKSAKDDDFFYIEEILENGGDLSFFTTEDADTLVIPEQRQQFPVKRLEDLGRGDDDPKKPPDIISKKSSNSNNKKKNLRELSSTTRNSFLSNFAQPPSSLAKSNPMQGGLHTRGEEDGDDDDNDQDLDKNNNERMTAEELEQMGGDPAFLDSESESQNDIFDEIAEMGGDPSFLEGYVEPPERMEEKEDEIMISTNTDPSFLLKNLVQSRMAGPNGKEENNQEESKEEPMQTTEKNPTGPYHTAVEGEIYNSPMEELEALGGDPFFLNQQDDIENDEADTGYNDLEEEAVPITTNLTHDPSFLVDYAQKHTTDTEDTDNKETKVTNIAPEKEIPDMQSSNDRTIRDEIEEMGGDPSFL